MRAEEELYVVRLWVELRPVSQPQMVHPQKRLDLKKALEACIGRLLEVKAVSQNQSRLSFLHLI
jgi:hypothetical protein